MIAVILCGGGGSRLWPISTNSRPKQFLDLTGSGCSMLQETVFRAIDVGCTAIYCVTVAEYEEEVRQHIESVSALLGVDVEILVESDRRGTASAIAVAAQYELIYKNRADSILVVMPADHSIPDYNDDLARHIHAAAQQATDDRVICFGVDQSCRDICKYGVIIPGRVLTDEALPILEVAEFKEKPTSITFGGSRALINSGIYLGTAKAFFEIIKARSKQSWIMPKNAQAERGASNLVRIEPCLTFESKKPSFDVLVSENAGPSLAVLPFSHELSAIWSDIGSWGELVDRRKSLALAGENCVKVHDYGAVHELNASRCTALSSGRDIALVGVEDLIVAESEAGVLVMRKGCEMPRSLLEILTNNPRREDRPWGYFLELSHEAGCRIKKIVIFPGKRISLQSHTHRSEIWTIIGGDGFININEHEDRCRAGDVYRINAGDVHRIENIGSAPLVFIEVQAGEVLSESDIIRYDDDFGRSG